MKELGFDPVLSMPDLEEFKKLLSKKKGTIKGVIMDQAFSAGVGNVSSSCSYVHLLTFSGWPMSEYQAERLFGG